jgi:predicted amidohydrolase
MARKITLYQCELSGKIPEKDYKQIKAEKADIFCLPEYFFHPDYISYEDSIKYMEKTSKDLKCILIGGSTVLKEGEKLYNACYIFDRGRQIGHYRKRNLYIREIGRITPGDEYKVFDTGNIKIGILICADALYHGAWESLSKLSPDIIFAPTFSPYKDEEVNAKFERDNNIYVSGAKTCNCPVVKVCCIGTFKDTRLQGRSLVASQTEVIWRALPDEEDKKIIKTIEL